MGFFVPASIFNLPTRDDIQGSARVTFAVVNANCDVDLITAELSTLKECDKAKMDDFGSR